MKSEASITNKIKKYLVENGYYFQKIAGGMYQTPGVPDIICGIEGNIYFFEVKTEIGKPTEIQKRYIKNLLDHDFVASVVRSLDEVKEVLGMPYHMAVIKQRLKEE